MDCDKEVIHLLDQADTNRIMIRFNPDRLIHLQIVRSIKDYINQTTEKQQRKYVFDTD
jgi:hypothetical protein